MAPSFVCVDNFIGILQNANGFNGIRAKLFGANVDCKTQQ